MARIAIDCDGVLADFSKAFIAEVNEVWPGRLSKDYRPNDWDWTSSGLTKAEIGKVWKALKKKDNWWLGLDALPGLSELAIWLTAQVNHDIWICTARADTAGLTTTKQTELWLHSCGLRAVNNFVGVITVPDGNDKRQIYEAMKIAYSLDDKTETIVDCNLIDSMEHHAYLLKQTWNEGAPVHNKVDSVEAFLKKIK